MSFIWFLIYIQTVHDVHYKYLLGNGHFLAQNPRSLNITTIYHQYSAPKLHEPKVIVPYSTMSDGDNKNHNKLNDEDDSKCKIKIHQSHRVGSEILALTAIMGKSSIGNGIVDDAYVS